MSTAKLPELLAPAGSLEKLHYALTYGADAVYAGAPFFSLRARENEFDLEKLQQGIEFAHQRQKKVYLTLNILARNLKIKPFAEQIGGFAALKPDAFIMSDPGLISIVREKHPEIPVHLSVQANCMNWQSVRFWQKVGVERIILSRELRLNEIKTIKDKVPDMELEAFVHGSICIAYSGRCLLSQYMSYRDANQGVCDNSCRYPMNLYASRPELAGEEYYLEDLRTPNEMYRITEDENGTYILNAKDLCLIEHIQAMAEAGICSFKVEGRTKSIYYLAIVTRAYRQALDQLASGKGVNEQLVNELLTVSNRGYHSGFLAPSNSDLQNYQSAARPQQTGFLGVVKKIESKRLIVEARNRITVGDNCQVVEPNTTHNICVVGIEDQAGSAFTSAHGGAGECILNIDREIGVSEESLPILRKDGSICV